jgi:glycosyltransferase involved in cell wall biosynthesis
VTGVDSRPRLSVVVPLRDPGYGGGLRHRAQVFLRGFLALARRYALSCEVVIVEWNPVPDAPRFRETLTWTTPATVRFIEVPPAVHEKLPNARRYPFQTTTARNVGVRRARGEYILITAADVLPNADLIQLLAAGRLSPKAFYRIDRRDLSEELPADWSVDEQLAFCRIQDVTVNTYYGSIRELGRPSLLARFRIRWRHRTVLQEYRRYQADPEYKGPPDRFGADQVITPGDGLHRNASGDFFLMHRDRWHDVRGYTQIPTWSHGDSILCWTAASAGLKQVILTPPARLYHQPHDRLGTHDWPLTDWRPWYARYLECRRNGTALIVNRDDWGLANEDLPEWSVKARA